jgi:hypothetical protein
MTFEAARDADRLNTQFGRVFALMQDGEWRTLKAISRHLGNASETAVSARLRDMRKPQCGSHTVQRRRVEDVPGLWQYRLVIA